MSAQNLFRKEARQHGAAPPLSFAAWSWIAVTFAAALIAFLFIGQ